MAGRRTEYEGGPQALWNQNDTVTQHRLELTKEHAVPDPESWSKAQRWEELEHPADLLAYTHVSALSAFGRTFGDIRLDCEHKVCVTQQHSSCLSLYRSPDWCMIVCPRPTSERPSADLHPPIAAAKNSAFSQELDRTIDLNISTGYTALARVHGERLASPH